jgi:photosystem II stability/assembly factor-like uncharacterized protein
MRAHRHLGPLIVAAGVLLSGASQAQGFRAVFSRDGIDGWAVGDSGVVYRSFDAGLSFTSSTLGQRTLWDVAARGFRVLVAADSGTLWRSENSGGSWTPTTHAGGADLLAIEMPSDSVAYAAGRGGVILKSVDGGASWTSQVSGTGADLHALRFTDPDHGWAVGGAGTVLRTVDGGAGWTMVAVGTPNALHAVDQRDSVVWVAGASGTALRSVDGGASWTHVDLELDHHSDVMAVHLQSPDSVVLAGGGGFIRQSADGGASWSFPIHAMHGRISGLHFTGAAGLACSDRHRAVMSTIDGGATWRFPNGASLSTAWVPKLVPGSVSVRGRTFALNPLDPNTIYCALGDKIYVTRTQGESWTQIAVIPSCNRTSSFIVSPKDTSVWVAAVAGVLPRRLLRSADHGQNWTTTLTHEFGEFGIPLGIDPDHPDTLYFGGDSDSLFRSTDGGATWARHSNVAFRSPCEILPLPDSSNVILIGDGITSEGQAEIYRSTDGGATFTLVETPPVGVSEIPGMATSRLRENVAFATGWSGGDLMRSTDHGATWQGVNPTDATWGVDVAGDDPNFVVFGVYGGGHGYLSRDGGMTFDATPFTGTNYAMFARDRGLVLALQSGGVHKLSFQYSHAPISAQSVTVTAPNGGEVWRAGSTRTITWSDLNLAVARIEYRARPDEPWEPVADVTGYQRAYSWDVPADVTSEARIRVRDAWDGVPADSSDGAFTIAAPEIAASPETLAFGEREIGVPTVLPVTIRNDGMWPLTVGSIATATARFVPGRASLAVGPGSSDTVGVGFFASTPGTYDDTLRIESDTKDGHAVLIPLSALAVDTLAADVVAPDGGEEWRYNAVHDVVWTANAVGSPVTLEYQTSPAGGWKTIVAGIPAQSSPYAWTIPFDTTSQARVRVREAGGQRFDASAGPFRLTAPILVEEPDPLELYLILVGDTQHDSLTLYNVGTAPCSILAVTSDNPCFWPGRSSLVLGPGERDTIGIHFTPQGEGPDSALFTLSTNDPYGARQVLVRGDATSNVGVEGEPPPAFALRQNEPNPFRSSTRIRYALPARTRVSLEVFDLQGQRVATLVRGEQGPGEFSHAFNPGAARSAGARGGPLAAGVYFCRLRAGSFEGTVKMLLLR